MPGSLVSVSPGGDGPKPVPNWGAAAPGGRGERVRPRSSRVAERNRHEVGALARLHAHQDAALAIALSLRDRPTHVGRRRHCLAVDIKNDVTSLELIACRAEIG